MSWSGAKVLVTGAAGFIGSHLVEQLVRDGGEIRAFVRYNSRNDYGWLEGIDGAIAKEIEIYRGDLQNPEAVRDAVLGCRVVFHLGALIPIPYSYKHPREFVETNIAGTLNVLEACRRHDVGRLVHVSSSEVYGTPLSVPIAESHRLHAQSPYAATKVAADQLALSYHAAFQTPVVVCRPFNTYGPRQSARAVIPAIAIQALRGSEIALGASTPTRDLLYVEDTAAGMIRCAQVEDIEGEVFNLGTGTELSVGAIVDAVGAVLGRELSVSVDSERLRPSGSEVERLVADASRARDVLHWESKVEFGTGLERTIEWFAGALSQYKPDIYNV